MAQNGGKRPGAGRKPGVPNKANQKRQEAVAATGITPLDVMIESMRYFRGLAAQHQVGGPAPNPKLLEEYLLKSVAVAKDAAPYVHPRLSSIAVKSQAVDLTKLSDEEFNELRRLQRIAVASSQPRSLGGRGPATRH